MKNILVPTDYSANARNAAEYAIHLAKAIGASIEFLHVFPEPELIEELPVEETSFLEQIKKEKQKLNKEAKFYNTNFGIKIKTTVYPGTLHEVIKTMMFNKAADLVIVGMKGVSVLDKLFWGNTTTNLLKHANYPMLIIPAGKKFMPVKHVTVAADYNTILEDNSLEVLKDLTIPFKGKAEIVHVDQDEEDLVEYVDKKETEKYFHRAFKGIKHAYTTLEADNVISGLIDFIKTKNSDIIVMVPQKHNVLQSLFLGSSTKKMVYQVEIPLLILPNAEA